MTNEELRDLVDNYRPSQETAAAMSQVSLLSLVGPSATGKTTIMEELARSNSAFHYVVGETSRQPRTNEHNGIDYFFRYRDEILEELKNGKLIQIVIGPNGDLYCTRLENFSTTSTNLFPLMPRGVRQFRMMSLKAFNVAFVVPASFEIWQSWLAKQTASGDWTQAKIHERMEEAKQSFAFALEDNGMHFVLNDTTERAVARLQQIVQGQAPDDETEAKETALSNYQHLLELK